MSIGKRMKEIRKHHGLTQGDFADSLNINKMYISKIERETREPSDQLIKLICMSFGVSERWLKTGEGEMLEPRTREEEVAALMGDLLRDEDEEFRVRLISAICKLDKDAITKLEKFARGLVGDPKG